MTDLIAAAEARILLQRKENNNKHLRSYATFISPMYKNAKFTQTVI